MIVFIVHGQEPGTIVGVYASLEAAQDATEARGREWYQTAPGEWHVGPGPGWWALIEAHEVHGQ